MEMSLGGVYLMTDVTHLNHSYNPKYVREGLQHNGPDLNSLCPERDINEFWILLRP